MAEPGRYPTVPVRKGDLLACIEAACSHLDYWGEPDPPWLDRLRAALSDDPAPVAGES